MRKQSTGTRKRARPCPELSRGQTLESGRRNRAEGAGAAARPHEDSSSEAPETAAPEPIAIIGIGCRFPGAPNPGAFWRLLREGVDAITEVPADRWNVDAFYDPTPGVRGKMITRWGGFLEQVDRFDAQFFGISPREAVRMDPQQRLLLEVSWEALEDGGQPVERLAGTRTGVFIGISGNDYGRMQMFPSLTDAYMGTGNANSVAANRISYVADLHGPSLTVDTACSSSLVAVHLACRSLWSGESTLALAGGVSCILSPTITINFSLAGMLSSDGRCKTFDAAANGYVRGEGAGIVVLKPLLKALTDGDPIYALIRGTAVNQDGHSQGLTVPSQKAQEAVMLEACRMAGVVPGDLDYVEAHGTGTPVGDPIEACALGAVLAIDRRPGLKCSIGSVKTNIGHLEAASGIAGLIKVALSLRNREVPPSLHFRNPNPRIPFHELPLRVQTRLGPWPNEPRRTLAGVNSFGFGGTNAHLVLAGFEDNGSRGVDRVSLSATLDSRSLHLLPLSAHGPEALRSLARACQDALTRPGSDVSEAALEDVCYTASLRRSHLDHRLATVARTREELGSSLEAFSRGETRPDTFAGHKSAGSAPKLAFVFPGQGSQWWAMGRQLLDEEPLFRESVERCDRLLTPLAGWSLLNELAADEPRSRLRETEVAQPAIFALQVALASLWRSWGVVPDAVVGHSVGEVAASHLAGIYSLDDAIRIIFHRGRLMQRATGGGRMAAVELSWDEAKRAITGYEDRLSIAAHNSPTSITLSGEPRALEAALELLQQKGVFVRMLQVNYAFHSSQMEPFLHELKDALEALEPREATLPFISTVTGGRVEGRALDAAYWVHNVRDAVLFSGALDRLIEEGHDVFVELSPHPTLFGPISTCLRHRSREGVVLPSLRRGEEDRRVMLRTLGALYAVGCPVDWNRRHPTGGRLVRLPQYPWQRERHWLEVDEAAVVGGAWLGPESAVKHPLLGRPLASALPTWEVELARTFPAYLDDHRIQGAVWLPGTAYTEMALAAAVQAFGAGPRALSEVSFQKPLVLPENGSRTVQVVLSPRADGDATFGVYSRPTKMEGSPSWTHHASGQIRRVESSSSAPEAIALSAIQARCGVEIPVEEFYRELKERGLEYGPTFRGLEQLWRRDGEALGRLQVPPALESDVKNYRLHPAILDACFQVMAAAVGADSASREGVYVPTGIDRLHVRESPALSVFSHARLRTYAARDSNTLEGDVRLLDDAGRVLAEVAGLRVQRVEAGPMAPAEDPSEWLCKLVWEPKTRAGEESAQLPPDYMPAPGRIAERLRARVSRRSEQQVEEEREDVLHYAEIDALSPAYILKAFRELGWELRPGHRVSTAALAGQMGVASLYARFLGRLLERLSEEGILRNVGSEWEVTRVPPWKDPEATRVPLLARHPAFEAELTLIGRCGQRLADVLRGRCDPLQLLFPEGSLSTAERLYQDSPFVLSYNMLVQEAISIALERLPDERAVRILEIGAGTCGTTKYVVPGLPPGQTEYVVTDVSRLFLLHAERKFRQFPFVSTALLDIERDPLEQGFDVHSFDVVLAGHVLHATSDLRKTLEHVRKLLKSEGLLVLLEGTGLHIMYDLVFAMTEGWWKFADLDLRPSHPLLSQAKWREILREVGFVEAAAVPEEEDEREDPSRQAVIVARAPRLEPKPRVEPALATVPEKSGSWLVFTDSGEVGRSLASLLGSRGERCIMVSPSDAYAVSGPDRYAIDPARPDDFHQLLEEALGSDGRPCRGVVHLWSLEATDDEPTLSALQEAQVLVCGSVLHLVQALVARDAPEPPRLWLATRGAQAVKGVEPVSVAQSPLWGLGRVIASEHSGLRCTNVDLGSKVTPDEIGSLFRELWHGDREDQIALRGEARYVRRLVRAGSEDREEKRRALGPDEPFRLEISTPGMLDGLTLRATIRREPGPGEVEIQVSAAGLNFRDVMKAMGLYPSGPDEILWLGDECAGTIVSLGEGVETLHIGDEVIATGPGCFGAFATTPAAFVVPKPRHLSFEEAATVPVAFLTAYYALNHLARLDAGERVLIHAAAGGVGLAAVQLARFAGAEIFATAGSPEKREYLKSLGIEHVMDSRSLAFAEEVMESTRGEGVDVVLNSLAGEAIAKSLSVLRANGRFLEIGKRDIYQNSQLGLRHLRHNVSFFAIDLGTMFARRPEFCGTLLRELMKELESGTLKPLPFRVFPISEVESAFRHMARARHIGKIVVSLEDPEVRVAPASGGGTRFRADGTYLITGGLGGFGLEIARWMVEHGAGHLVLMGRSGARSPEAREAVEALRRAGADVVVAAGDVADREQVARVFSDIEKSAVPLRGIVHAAMVLDDRPVLELNLDRLKRVMDPKMGGAWNLHRLSADASLDFFVLFSSAASLIGSPGQGNYVAANAFLEALAYYRRAQGRPAMTIQWGRLTDVGYVARHEEVGQRLERLGLKGFTPRQAVTTLGRLLQQNPVLMGVVRTDWNQWKKYHSATSLLLSHYLDEAAAEASGEVGARLRDSLLAAGLAERQGLMASYIQRELGRVLRLDPSRVDSQKPLNTLGLDSLMAVELTTRIETDLRVTFPMAALAQGASLSQLATQLVALVMESAGPSDAAESTRAIAQRVLAGDRARAEELSAKIDQLSDQEVDSLLGEMLTQKELSGDEEAP